MPKEGAKAGRTKLLSVGDGLLKANTGGPVTESPATTSLLSPTPPEPLQLNPQGEPASMASTFSANATLRFPLRVKVTTNLVLKTRNQAGELPLKEGAK